MKKPQWKIILSIMLSGRWWTIPQLQKELKRRTGEYAMETTISARIRDLRKSEYGGYQVERRCAKDNKLHQYRVVM